MYRYNGVSIQVVGHFGHSEDARKENVMKTRGKACIEKLESRVLLSAWSTVDSFQLVAGQRAGALAMTADPAGNAYAAGTASGHGVVREKSSGGTSWTTIEDLPAASFFGMAVDAAGDVFVSGSNNTGYGIVLERVAGQAAFSQVDSFIGSAGYGTLSAGVAADTAGNVYAAGYTLERVSTGKHSSTNLYSEVVRERPAGASVVSTVDHFSENSGLPTFGHGVTVIGGGASAGVYVIGYYNNSNDHWLVRKSSDSGKTWSTVDDFVSGTSNAQANAVTGDAFGNVYVVGQASGQWIVRKSANGRASWSINHDYQLSPSYTGDQASAIGADLAGVLLQSELENGAVGVKQ